MKLPRTCYLHSAQGLRFSLIVVPHASTCSLVAEQFSFLWMGLCMFTEAKRTKGQWPDDTQTQNPFHSKKMKHPIEHGHSPERTPQEGAQMASKQVKEAAHTICHQGNACENSEMLLHTRENGPDQSTDTTKCWWGCGAMEPITADRNTRQCSHFGKQLSVSYKTKPPLL